MMPGIGSTYCVYPVGLPLNPEYRGAPLSARPNVLAVRSWGMPPAREPCSPPPVGQPVASRWPVEPRRRGARSANASWSWRREFDVQLREHVAEVVLDRARADEQPRTDLGIREPVAGELCDLQLWSGELIARLRVRARMSRPWPAARDGHAPQTLGPIEANISWAVRNCSRASTRRCSRRSHSPCYTDGRSTATRALV